MVRRSVLLLAAAGTFVLTSTFGGGAAVSAQGGEVIADWRMDEAAGSRVLVDSSGRGHHGTSGSSVQVGVRDGADVLHRFAPISNPTTPDAGRLHVVSDRDAIDAGSGDFAVNVRFRTTTSSRNIVQKGQSGTAGGMWKVEVDDQGRAVCLFRGSDGSAAVRSSQQVTDGRWHLLRCERSASGAVLGLDGVVQDRRSSRSGTISNSWDLTIGGKPSCNATGVECDYFVGDVDFVKLDRQLVK